MFEYVYLAQMKNGFAGETKEGINVLANVRELETPQESKEQRFELEIIASKNSLQELRARRMGDARFTKLEIDLKTFRNPDAIKTLIKEQMEKFYHDAEISVIEPEVEIKSEPIEKPKPKRKRTAKKKK